MINNDSVNSLLRTEFKMCIRDRANSESEITVCGCLTSQQMITSLLILSNKLVLFYFLNKYFGDICFWTFNSVNIIFLDIMSGYQCITLLLKSLEIRTSVTIKDIKE